MPVRGLAPVPNLVPVLGLVPVLYLLPILGVLPVLGLVLVLYLLPILGILPVLGLVPVLYLLPILGILPVLGLVPVLYFLPILGVLPVLGLACAHAWGLVQALSLRFHAFCAQLCACRTCVAVHVRGVHAPNNCAQLGVPCKLRTGEEVRDCPHARHTSCTMEMAPVAVGLQGMDVLDVAVLDEIQVRAGCGGCGCAGWSWMWMRLC